LNERDEIKDVEGETLTAIGVYNGQVDPHTIEIETDDGPTAFQLTTEARNDVENLTVGEEVTYTYFVNGEQLIIESIDHTWRDRHHWNERGNNKQHWNNHHHRHHRGT